MKLSLLRRICLLIDVEATYKNSIIVAETEFRQTIQKQKDKPTSRRAINHPTPET
jgi:hypothetical protein